MWKLITGVISIGSSTFAAWKIIAIAGLLLVGTNAINTGITGVVLYNKGWRDADNMRAAKEVLKANAHADWLLEMAKKNGVIDGDDAAAELSNEQLTRAIYNAIQTGNGGSDNQCLPDGFLRELDKLR